MRFGSHHTAEAIRHIVIGRDDRWHRLIDFGKRSDVLQLLVLLVMTGVVYSNSLTHPFQFDDWHVIPENPAIKRLSNIPSYFKDTSAFSILPGNRDYRPVFLSLGAVCWWLGAGSTLPFHALSTALHMGNVLLLFFIVRRTLVERGSLGGLPAPQAKAAAFLAAALFAVHPLASQTVNYISAQSELEAAFFYLLSFLLYLTGTDAMESGTRRRRFRLACSYTAYLLGLLSKPVAITLPLTLLLWRMLSHGSSASSLIGHSRIRSWIASLRSLAPYLILSGAYLLLRRGAGTTAAGSLLGESESTYPVLTWYATQTKALVFYYLKSAFFPFGLNVDREYALSTSFLDRDVLAAIAALAIIGFVLARQRNQRPLVFWSLWFPTCLLVVTYAVVLGQVVNEHRVYLSLGGICAVLGILVVKLWRRFPLRMGDSVVGSRSGRALTLVLVLLVLTFFGHRTRAQNDLWSSELKLWGNAAKHRGTWRAHMNHALALEAKGRADEALEEFKTAVAIAPLAWPHMNLGLAYVKRGTLELGLDHLRTAVGLWPTLPEAHLYYGYGLQTAGRHEEAETEMLKSIALRPAYAKAYSFLGKLYEAQDRIPEAITAHEHALAIDPDDASISDVVDRLKQGTADHLEGASAAIQAGEFVRAVEILSSLRAKSPGDAEVLFNLGWAHQSLGHRADAIQTYEELLRVQPNHVQGSFNLAYAYRDGETKHEWSRSAELFRRVIELDPGYAVALHHLATVFWKLENTEMAREYDRLYLARGVHSDLRSRSEERLAGSPPDR